MRSFAKYLVLFVLVAALTHVSQLAADQKQVGPIQSLQRTGPLLVRGGVSIFVRPYDTMLQPVIRLKRNNQPVSNMRVTVDGRKVKESQPGRYSQLFKGYSPPRSIKITINSNQPRIQLTSGIQASADVGRLMTFKSPRPDAKFKLAGLKSLTISWFPAGGNVTLKIYHLAPDNSAGKKILERSGIMGSSITVSPSLFRAKQKYGIYISRKMADFTIKGKVAPASSLYLRQSVGTYIYPL